VVLKLTATLKPIITAANLRRSQQLAEITNAKETQEKKAADAQQQKQQREAEKQKSNQQQQQQKQQQQQQQQQKKSNDSGEKLSGQALRGGTSADNYESAAALQAATINYDSVPPQNDANGKSDRAPSNYDT
jgi:membrane protein involved in colicin uptake